MKRQDGHDSDDDIALNVSFDQSAPAMIELQGQV